MANTKSSSPYTKYQKKPHGYSETYRRWKSAVTNGRNDEARDLAARHSAQFGMGRRR